MSLTRDELVSMLVSLRTIEGLAIMISRDYPGTSQAIRFEIKNVKTKIESVVGPIYTSGENNS